MMKPKAWLAVTFAVILLSSCSVQQNAKIRILDAKTSVSVDDKYMPVQVANVFPAGTSKVFLWFSWADARKDIKIMAKWRYVTDDMPVLDYAFAIPRKTGTGSVSLSMPEGKTLPAGLYRVTLELDNQSLRSLTFKVLEK
ncbi:MAG: hypothetical protein V1927_05130 [Candidatus Omnitrophota bacterium]